MPGMKMETYGTECSKEFDYDDEVDYEVSWISLFLNACVPVLGLRVRSRV